MEARVSYKTRVLIAEDLQLISRILAGYIDGRPDMEVVGEARNGIEAVEAHRRLRPDLTLMDISMPELDGISATRQILREDPRADVLILTANDPAAHASLAAEAGAVGFLQKNCGPEELIAAIHAVGSGKTVFPKGVETSAHDRPRLTGREVEILRSLASGKSNKQIAASMFISERTVRNHAYNIYRKLRVFDRTQAVIQAARHGFISLRAV